MSRVLQPFVVLDLVPHALTLRESKRGMAFVVVEFAGLTSDRAALVVEKLKQMPCVSSARFSDFSSDARMHVVPRHSARVGNCSKQTF